MIKNMASVIIWAYKQVVHDVNRFFHKFTERNKSWV